MFLIAHVIVMCRYKMWVLCGVGAAVTPKVNFVKIVVYSEKVFSNRKPNEQKEIKQTSVIIVNSSGITPAMRCFHYCLSHNNMKLSHRIYLYNTLYLLPLYDFFQKLAMATNGFLWFSFIPHFYKYIKTPIQFNFTD